MTETPLSDVMAVHAETGSQQSYDRFVELFRRSVVGIMVDGMPGVDEELASAGELSARSTTHGDGRSRILAYADPEVFLVNFGARFNAGVPGEILLGMAAADPECAGVLVNSATQEISLVITRPSGGVPA
jgi:hypothetical protein